MLKLVIALVCSLGLAAPVAAQHHGGSHSSGGSHGYRSYGGSHSHAPSYRSHGTTPSHRGGSSHYRSHAASPRTHVQRAPRAPAAPGSRNRHGRLQRSEEAKREFMRRSGHPHGWPGHVVDHVVPLACGGSDSPSNMQWQTTAEAKAKDRTERRGCGRR